MHLRCAAANARWREHLETGLDALGLPTDRSFANFVLPRFANFYASYEAQLPLMTRILMSVATLAEGSGNLVLIGIVVAVVWEALRVAAISISA